MRIMRIFAVVVFVACLAWNLWATAQYNKDQNKEGPKLTCDSDYLEVSIEDGKAALMRGIHASDAQDGDLTDQVLVASSSHFLEPGVFDVDYVVFDSHRNFATLTRRVCYTDYTSPKFHLSMPLVFQVGQNIRYLNYVTATDALDGDITDKIKVKASSVSNYTAGTYPVLLEVTNSHGDTSEIELKIVVQEGQASGPRITLHNYVYYIVEGTRFDPYAAIHSVVDSRGNPMQHSDVSVLGMVDTQTPGCYQLIFTATDSAGEGRSYLMVVVTEEVADNG